MMEEFKVGDCVELNSGSPKMTVNRVYNSKNNDGDDIACADCTWFNESAGIYMYESFYCSCLKKQCK